MIPEPYRTDGEALAYRIREELKANHLKIAYVAKKSKIPVTTVYADLRCPGKAQLYRLLTYAKIAGIRQITLNTYGRYL